MRSSAVNGISIVIPTHNEPGLKDCVRSLSGLQGADYEVIIVDDGSTKRYREGTEDFLKGELRSEFDDIELKYVEKNLRQGAGIARNAGVEESNPEYSHVVFVDADCAVTDRDMLKRFRQEFERNIIYTGGSYRLKPDYRKSVAQRILHSAVVRSPINFYNARMLPFHINPGGYCGVKKDVFLKVGGFKSETCVGMLEDTDFAERLYLMLKERKKEAIRKNKDFIRKTKLQKGEILFGNPVKSLADIESGFLFHDTIDGLVYCPDVVETSFLNSSIDTKPLFGMGNLKTSPEIARAYFINYLKLFVTRFHYKEGKPLPERVARWRAGYRIN